MVRAPLTRQWQAELPWLPPEGAAERAGDSLVP